MGRVACGLVLLACAAYADELSDAAGAGDLAKVKALLASGKKYKLDFALASHGWKHPKVALLLIEHGAKWLVESVADGLGDTIRNVGLDAETAAKMRDLLPRAPLLAGSLWIAAPKAAPLVSGWMDDKDPAVRRAAAAVLGAYLEGDSAIMSALAKAMEDEDAEVRRLAIAAWTRLRWPKGVKGETLEAMKALKRAFTAARRRKDATGESARLADLAVRRHGEIGVTGSPLGRRERVARTRKLRRGLAEPAVDKALEWLAANQDVNGDGRWDSDRWGGGKPYDIGVSGVALLALLGAGHAPGADGPYEKNVRRGLGFLMATQDVDGCFGSRADMQFVYNHLFATHALLEALILTDHPHYRVAAERAVRFIEGSRNPQAGWRYEPRGGMNDTSVTCLAARALNLARLAGFTVDDEAFRDSLKWVDKMSDGFKVGYNMPGGGSPRPEGMESKWPADETGALPASALLTRLLLGESIKDKRIQRDAEWLLQKPPRWDVGRGSIDMYYWLWGTAALYQIGGKPWKAWSKALVEAAVRNQSEDGSWPPLGPWGGAGGRIYSTAMMVLALEAPYRNARGE